MYCQYCVVVCCAYRLNFDFLSYVNDLWYEAMSLPSNSLNFMSLNKLVLSEVFLKKKIVPVTKYQ